MDIEAIKEDIIKNLKGNNGGTRVIYSLCDSIDEIRSGLTGPFNSEPRDGDAIDYITGLIIKLNEYVESIPENKRVYMGDMNELYFCWPLDDLDSRIEWLNDNM